MKRKFIVVLEADTEEKLPYIKEDIERELGCACTLFDTISVVEVEPDKETEERA